MGRHSIIFNNRKTVKSITLIAILVTMLSSSLLPTNIVASGLTVTVETNKSVYMPGEMLTISGTVRMDGAPVPYAYISMTITGPGVNQTNIFSADTNGFYSTSNPIPQGTPIGDYNVTVATEYKDKLGHVIYSLASKVFTVAAPSAEDVTITVNGPNDTPLADANVILYDHYNGQWINNTLTNATGIAVMKVYPSILFDILVYKTGYGATQEGAVTGFLFDTNDTVGYTSPCQITLALTSVDFGTLNGTIVDATDSTPLDSALVSILAYIKGRTYWVSSVSSAGDGSYSTGLNTGLWRVWTDRRENGNLTHIGTWNDAIITNSTTKTLDMQLWPIAELVIESLEPIEQQYEILLINETYGGVVWRSDISFPLDLPLTMDIPAVNGNVIILTKTRVFSSNIEALPGDTVTLNASLYDKQYEIWSYPNDWEKDRLFGNLTIVSNVVDLETLGQEGPTQFVDPEGTLKEYLLVDRGPGIPTIWRTMGTPTRMDVGCYYQFFDLDALNAPEGYYYTIVLIKNSTGDVVSASPDWFNRFRYQVQPITAKGTYNIGEDVDVRFKVYGSSYKSDVTVTYELLDGNWFHISGGCASVDTTTKMWNITLPGEDFSQMPYHLIVRILGGKEHIFDFTIQNYTSISFNGQILPNATMDLWSNQYGGFTITADQMGVFNTTLPQGWYNAWFHYDDKNTPGIDARDTSMSLSLYSDVYNFPDGFPEYQWRPLTPAFEVRGITFNDVNGNGVFDSGDHRLPEVNVRASEINGREEWFPPSSPDGSFRLFLQPDTIYRLKATLSNFEQNDTAMTEFGSGTAQGDLLIVNVPMVSVPTGTITGYVMLDNGTFLENAGVNFMDQYWSWLGSVWTNSTGGYVFNGPANRPLNIWIDPHTPELEGKDVRGIVVGENATLILNVTLYRPVWIGGIVAVNGTGTGAQIVPLDENWNRVTWDRGCGPDGMFNFTVPLSTKKLLIWSWGQGFLIQDVDLHLGTNDLGVLNMTTTDPRLSLNVHTKNWDWELSAGQRADIVAELRNTTMWEPIQGADITFWAWNWDNGTLIAQGTVSETPVHGVYEGNFTPEARGHYRVLILANVTTSAPHIAFNDFWVSATDKKMYLTEARGEYGLSEVQSGNAKVQVKLVSTVDGSPITGYAVWFEIRKFTDINTWQMENAISRTRATELGNGIYEITIPAILGNGSYWMEIMAGDWETSQRLGFTISEEPTPTVNIYGWVTKSPTPVEGAIVEAWMEAKPYLYVTTTNASGYYSLPVPQKSVFSVHVYWDNATTTGIDYTTIPEWNRIELKVINILNNATLARLGDVTLSILRGGEPTQVEVQVWDTTTNPSRLVMWSGTWRGAGLFNEKMKEGTYLFEVGVFWPPAGPWHYWWQSPSVSADTPLVDTISVPIYDVVVQGSMDTGNTWRVKPGDTVTMRIWEQQLMAKSGENGTMLPTPDLNDLLQNSEKRLEVFYWVPGKMAEGYAYNDTVLVLKEEPGKGRFLELNFTIPEYYSGGDYGLYVFLYNATGNPKVFLKAEGHLMVAEMEMGLTVVPYTTTRNGTVMAAALIMVSGSPATGASVEFEVYDCTWQLVDVITATQVSPGVYLATFTVPSDTSSFGWWTVKAIATINNKEAVAYQGFNVSPS